MSRAHHHHPTRRPAIVAVVLGSFLLLSGLLSLVSLLPSCSAFDASVVDMGRMGVDDGLTGLMRLNLRTQTALAATQVLTSAGVVAGGALVLARPDERGPLVISSVASIPVALAWPATGLYYLVRFGELTGFSVVETMVDGRVPAAFVVISVLGLVLALAWMLTKAWCFGWIASRMRSDNAGEGALEAVPVRGG